jgi:hypothetical protein
VALMAVLITPIVFDIDIVASIVTFVIVSDSSDFPGFAR